MRFGCVVPFGAAHFFLYRKLLGFDPAVPQAVSFKTRLSKGGIGCSVTLLFRRERKNEHDVRAL